MAMITWITHKQEPHLAHNTAVYREMVIFRMHHEDPNSFDDWRMELYWSTTGLFLLSKA